MHYSVDLSKKWDYENGFYLSCETSRIGKFISQLEIYKKILNLPGDILEFGVYKGTSLVRLLSFRNLLENEYSRKIVGFDMFGKFPRQLSLESDKKFVEQFENSGGYGIKKDELDILLNHKGIKNYSLIEGNVLETLPIYIAENPAIKIALLHLDLDVYEPTKFVLESLWNKVVNGGIIMLDDYGTVEGETKAVDEFFLSREIQINKMKYNYIPSYIIKQ